MTYPSLFSTVIDSDYSGKNPTMTDEYELRVFKHEYKHSSYAKQMGWLDGAFYSWYGGRKFRRNEPETFKKVIEGIIAVSVIFGFAVAVSYLPLFIIKYTLFFSVLVFGMSLSFGHINKSFVPAFCILVLGILGYFYQSTYPSAHAFTGFHALDKIVYLVMMGMSVLALIRRIQNRYVWKYLDHIGRKYNIVVDDWFGV